MTERTMKSWSTRKLFQRVGNFCVRVIYKVKISKYFNFKYLIPAITIIISTSFDQSYFSWCFRYWLERYLKYSKIKLKSQFRETYLYEVESRVLYELLKYHDTIQSQFVGYNFQYRYV